ncbi:hypothetical protein LCGC14_1156820 [marine sediment metagenome]|uniref:Uncharacterized protein n=1 Tax=marine sediment metagenome TaxID=412755 RepID=A0A0F9PC36_9ZZZZ
MNKCIISGLLLSVSSIAMAQDYITPADIPADAQQKMYSIITDYNKCMMNGRLNTSLAGNSTQQQAENIMNSCQSHLDDLDSHLNANKVEPSLVMGMTKRLRSKAARQLMAQTMNSYAAQASAMINADKMKEEESAE